MAVPVLSDPKWLMDLAFLVDITHELNVLNKKLQGQGQLVSAAFDNVRAFSTKLVLWKAQLSQTNLCHFPACKALLNAGTPFSGEKYVDALMRLQEEFDHRFADFKTHRATFQIFADPFSFDVQDAPPVLQMELIDLQCNSVLKAKFREVSGKEDKLGQFLGIFFGQNCPYFSLIRPSPIVGGTLNYRWSSYQRITGLVSRGCF